MSTPKTPPSQGGPHVRLFDKEFKPLYDNTTDDRSLADVMSALENATLVVDEPDGTRTAKRVHTITYTNL